MTTINCNDWFLSLSPERQSVLIADKWLLANAAWEAATSIEREECARVCTDGVVPGAGPYNVGRKHCAEDIKART